MEDDVNKVKISISSCLSNLALLRAMVRAYLSNYNIGKTDEVQILSVVDELATNAIEHAYNYEIGKIKIILNFYKKTVFLTVEDFGKGYPTSSNSKEDGGIGLAIAKKLVDVFKVEKKSTGTVFKIEKKIREAV